MDAQPLLWIVPISGLVAVLVAGYFAYDVLRSPIGTPEMQKVAGAIYVAAVAFIKRQYRTIFLLALGGMVVIGVVIYFFESAPGVSSDRARDPDRRSRSSSARCARWPPGSSACSSR